MVRTLVQLTEGQVEGLKKLAAEKHKPVARLVREAVDLILNGRTAVDIEEQRKRAIEAAGRFASGKGDISKKHDRYLAEAFHK